MKYTEKTKKNGINDYQNIDYEENFIFNISNNKDIIIPISLSLEGPSYITAKGQYSNAKKYNSLINTLYKIVEYAASKEITCSINLLGIGASRGGALLQSGSSKINNLIQHINDSIISGNYANKPSRAKLICIDPTEGTCTKELKSDAHTIDPLSQNVFIHTIYGVGNDKKIGEDKYGFKALESRNNQTISTIHSKHLASGLKKIRLQDPSQIGEQAEYKKFKPTNNNYINTVILDAKLFLGFINENDKNEKILKSSK